MEEDIGYKLIKSINLCFIYIQFFLFTPLISAPPKHTSATGFSVSVTNYYLFMTKLIMFIPDFNRKTT